MTHAIKMKPSHWPEIIFGALPLVGGNYKAGTHYIYPYSMYFCTFGNTEWERGETGKSETRERETHRHGPNIYKDTKP
jgi:hypothetical protein